MGVVEAVECLRSGKPVILFDGEEREGEADFLVHARFVDSGMVGKIRRECGGLICLATSSEVAVKLGLPFLSDLFAQSGSDTLKRLNYSKTPYGDKPAFSVSVNHKDTFTGISDCDRSLTIREFEKLVSRGLNNGVQGEFAGSFRAPGHVHLLVSRGLKQRRGHTEMAVELSRLAGSLPPAIVLCEMLGTGRALSKIEAMKYAQENKFTFVEAEEIISAK
ncbi:3,4-dihydroxy-2-butanone-4-phosphate synthase [Candidatus Micrarchaeota archaeon]|nr:3,4-dihydroxy-2-butanone-4-phosphate synthase [Candidatus Micrarchaeota archaeon]